MSITSANWPKFLSLIVPACVICAVYVPTLSHPFDFVDDGCLVYAESPPTATGWAQRTWNKTVLEFKNRGPFRPVTWAHWEGQAAAFSDNAVLHRIARLSWAVLSAMMLLWLLRELRVHPAAALLVTAAAMWNPIRNQMWIGLGLTEAFAMPYALFALIAAIRAARGRHSWSWDLAGFAAMLAALACKNTFAAVVPVQIFLRLTANGFPTRETWRHGAFRAGVLSLTLLLPIIHFAVFRLDGRERAYQVTGPSIVQAHEMLKTTLRSASLEYIAPALLLFAIAAWWFRRSRNQTESSRTRSAVPLFAALILLVLGMGIYLPIRGMAGRYTMPAVWGADIALGVFLSYIMQLRRSLWRRAGVIAFGLGLFAMLAVNMAKQDRYAARSRMHWQALEHVENITPPNSRLAYFGQMLPQSRNALATAEGVHFIWHLHGRGRTDLTLENINGRTAGASDQAFLAITDNSQPPAGRPWRLTKKCRTSYWLGRRHFQCYVWSAGDILARRQSRTNLENNQ